jgi:hypothetical protein
VLKDLIADSHIALADQIRATEQSGYEFDPRQHFPEAIRRVDVKAPVQSLAENSTVLVDTPGLYSRMNFGYDVLTREFRDSAACAVFVVKTDNLFLEQVFAEFNQLLDLFSRIFLVINVDSSKRDLLPDGSLQPSAESQDPAKIIDAFKTLSMAGPLRVAFENGRLRLHAIDLLSAASTILKPAGTNGDHAPQREAFDAFQRDLTDYLNSSDYTLEFIRDSLRQGANLCTESRAIATGPEVSRLRDEQESLAEQLRALDERIAAADRLLRVDWDAAFEKVRSENRERAEGSSRAGAAQLRTDLRTALDRWYETNAGLKPLTAEHWNPLVLTTAGSIAEATRNRLRNLLDVAFGGAEPPSALIADLNSIEFRLGPVGQSALPQLNEADAAAPYELALDATTIPVRKSFLDWILFRSQAKVRRRLFGDDAAKEIPAELKPKRLPETSREVVHSALDKAIDERFPSLPLAYSDELLKRYVAEFRNALLAALQGRRETFVRQRAEVRTPFEANERLLISLERLHDDSAEVTDALAELAVRENVAPPAPLLAEPAPPIYAVDEPAYRAAVAEPALS